MQLLDFVALYGLVLMPMGTVIFVDHYWLPKLGLQRQFASVAGKSFNWAAGLAWILTLFTCLMINQFAGIEIFFLGLPGWGIAALLFIVLSKYYQHS